MDAWSVLLKRANGHGKRLAQWALLMFNESSLILQRWSGELPQYRRNGAWRSAGTCGRPPGPLAALCTKRRLFALEKTHIVGLYLGYVESASCAFPS